MDFEHYTIRPICTADAEDLFGMIESNRKRLEDFFAGTVSRTKTLEDTRTHVANIVAKAGDRTYYSFGVFDTSTQRMIGFADIKSIDWSIPKAELGCFMDGAYEGRGVATRVLAKIVEHGFDVLQFTKLLLRTHESNLASRRVAEKNGFQMEGIIRKDYRTTKGTIVDLMYYGKIREQ